MDGGYYKGQWEAGLKHGLGRDVLDNEANYYQGHFISGKRQGHGILVYRDQIYDGEWLNDKMDGFGILKNETSGFYYEGYFKANHFDGKVLMHTDT